MLLDIIREIIEEAYPSFSASDTLSNSISKEIKDLAKKLFFEGKVNDLKDYIFDLPNEKNESTHKLFIESIQPW